VITKKTVSVRIMTVGVVKFMILMCATIVLVDCGALLVDVASTILMCVLLS